MDYLAGDLPKDKTCQCATHTFWRLPEEGRKKGREGLGFDRAAAFVGYGKIQNSNRSG